MTIFDEAGDLATVPVEHALAELLRRPAPGALLVSSGFKQKAVEVERGRLVTIFSNLNSERLGDRLVRDREITHEMLEAAVLAQERAPDTYLGEQLVGAGALSVETLNKALQAQAEEKFLELLSWKQGRYRFFQRKTLRKATRPPEEIEMGRLLRIGARAHIPTHRIDGFWNKHDGDVLVAPSDRAITLTPREWDVLEELSPPLPVQKLLNRSRADRRVVYGFLLAGILSFEQPPLTG